mgnify:CR=1 FL=1
MKLSKKGEYALRALICIGLSEALGRKRLQVGEIASSDNIPEKFLEQIMNDLRDGGFVKQGYSTDLDENRALRDETRHVIAGLQNRYCEISGVKSLKVKHNNVLGYFIEVPAAVAAVLQAPDKAGLFIHRQTVASAMRFITTELASLDQRIAAAADRAALAIPPAWPLASSVAVNPFVGQSSENLATVAAQLLGPLAQPQRTVVADPRNVYDD